MVRARGFFPPPTPSRDTSSPAAPQFDGEPPGPQAVDAESPWFESLAPPAFAGEAQKASESEAASLDLREQEALAWGAGERAAPAPIDALAPERPPQTAFAESEPDPLRDFAPSGPSQTIEPEISGAAASHAAVAAPAASAVATAEDFLRSFAKGAGIPDHIFARQNSLKVAEDLGALMRLSVEDLTQLLSARFKAKRFARTSSQTMIQALDNNPLKFAPTPEDALKIMFGPRTSGYLDAKRAFEGAFTDLKTHQVNTFAAMQQAVRMLVEDLDPKAIEDVAGKESGLAALLGGHKARLWDLYLARWQAKTLRHEDGLVDAFMLYFAQCYDQAKDTK
ncbi:type VI secretion system-associated FHA domain protein TagH [Methylocella silvestris]|uniref:Type VI secretion system-associated FHA domain protein TagH n=2 Tax=Methylocella silvestris TaxID=199596 RepID=A0A2J7TIC2_METSI|nr:type VI secretion system-associated FHA domain protein TagH [Methylocella silvestris]